MDFESVEELFESDFELVELLESPNQRSKVGIAYLLASIARGRGYLEVHARPGAGESEWERIFKERGSTLEYERDQEAQIVLAVQLERVCRYYFLFWLIIQSTP